MRTQTSEKTFLLLKIGKEVSTEKGGQPKHR